MTPLDLVTIAIYGVMPPLTLLFGAVALRDAIRFRGDEKRKRLSMWLLGTSGLALGFGLEDAWWHKMFYARAIGIDSAWMLDAKPYLGLTAGVLVIGGFCLLFALRTASFGGKPSWSIALGLGVLFSGAWAAYALHQVGITI